MFVCHSNCNREFRIKLGEFIERKEVQYFLTGLVVFDIIVLSLELLLESVVVSRTTYNPLITNQQENAEGVDHHALHVAGLCIHRMFTDTTLS